MRVVRDGEVLDPATWTRRARTGRARLDDLVDPGRVLAAFHDGATIVLQSLQRWWRPLSRFCRDVEGALGHPVQANAYLTPPGAAGLTPHHDTHDVFVLQVHGTKHWTVREPLVVAPLARHRSDHERAALQPVLFEIDLEPGDCLYLPRGFIHSAATQDGASLHLTVGVLATTVHDVLGRLVDRTAEEPAFRRNLPRTVGGPGEDRGAVAKQVVADLVRWLERLDLGDEELTRTLIAPRPGPPLLDGALLELVDLDSIADTTVLARRSAWTARTTGEVVELDLGDRHLQLPIGLLDAVSRLIDGNPHAVRDLGDLLDGPSRLVLARRLVREGVLRRADGP